MAIEILKEYMEEGIIEESPDYKNFYRLKKMLKDGKRNGESS